MAQPRLDFAQQLAIHRARFPGPHVTMVVNSMMAGNTAGELWNVAQTKEPPLLVLWDNGNNVFYLAGDCKAESSSEALAEIIAGRLRHALSDGLRRFKVRALSPSLEAALPRLFPGIDLRPSVAHFSVHDATRQEAVPPPTLSDVAFLPITAALLNQDDLADVDCVREEIHGMWPSEDRFQEHGFGVVAVAGDAVICWCTAEYVGPTSCGIGIETARSYRRRGIATATAARFIREARTRGLVPCWECDSTNIASVRVAEKAGFVRQAEETYWIGFLTKG